MARSVRDLSLAFTQLAGPDGQDGYSSSAAAFDARSDRASKRPLRVGWLVEPGFGPIDREVAATVQAAAEALKGLGHFVEPVRILPFCFAWWHADALGRTDEMDAAIPPEWPSGRQDHMPEQEMRYQAGKL